MRKSEIKVGGEYVAKVSGKLTTVRVDAIREVNIMTGNPAYGSKRCQPRFDVTNLRTGRKTTFRSATKFRYPKSSKPATKTEKIVETFDAGGGFMVDIVE